MKPLPLYQYAELMQAIHRGAASTRGAAASIAAYRPETGEIVYAGVGNIAAAVIGAQPVAGRGRGRIGQRGKVVQRAVVVAVGRMQCPVAALVELLLDEGVQPVGWGIEVAAEHRLGRVLNHREVPLALVAHDQRLVVGQQLGPEAEHKQDGEDHQADIAQPVAAKTQPGAARWRHLGEVGRFHRSNFTRGSTQT